MENKKNVDAREGMKTKNKKQKTKKGECKLTKKLRSWNKEKKLESQ